MLSSYSFNRNSHISHVRLRKKLVSGIASKSKTDLLRLNSTVGP